MIGSLVGGSTLRIGRWRFGFVAVAPANINVDVYKSTLVLVELVQEVAREQMPAKAKGKMAVKARDAKEEQSGIGRRRAAARVEGKNDYKAKRAELIKAAAAVFKEKGYEAATLNDVAQRVGSDRASLYYYVGGKEELFQEAIRESVEANLAEVDRILKLDESPDRKLRLIVERLISSYEEHYPHMYVYIQEDMAKVAAEDTEWAREMTRHTRRFEASTLKLINEAIAEGIFRDDIRPDLIANALFGMLNWTHRWFKPGHRLTAAQLADSFWKILFDGLRAD
jgi:TetR/AcrR family transcriptional regulator, cholesterol catabolism regulator